MFLVRREKRDRLVHPGRQMVHNQSYLYWLWFLVGVIGRLRLGGRKVRLTQHAMQYNMDEQNNMIWRLSKTKVSHIN
jgi:hypothetical protein